MKPFITTPEEAEVIRQYLKQEFGKYRECCELFMPELGTILEVILPLQSCFLMNPNWGTRNLVDGCIPTGIYRIEGSREPGRTQHFINLEPVNGSTTITACVGYAYHSMMDWRGARKSTPSLPAPPPQHPDHDQR